MALENYIADAALVKKLGNLPGENITAEKIEPYFPQARMQMKKFIGLTLYELFADTETWAEDADYTADDTELMKSAEAYMVLSIAIRPLNVNSGGAGFVKATGFGDSRKEILSENDIESLADYYREEAEKILEGYVPETDIDEDDAADKVQAGCIKMAAV